MDQILFAGFIAFFITLFAIPEIIFVSEKKSLFDNPDLVRKLHKKPVSSLGGAGIFLGFIVSILLAGNLFSLSEMQYYIATFILIFFIGIKDDLVDISAFTKFIGQSLVAVILMFKAHLLITDMQGFLGLGHLNASFSYLVTFLALIVIINAFNLIDGIDGLAASLGLISTLVFGIFFIINGAIAYAVISFGFAGSLAAFLIYNFQPAKIFMGDTGSLLMGVVNAILVIKFVENSGGYTVFSMSALPAVGFAILLIPLMDTLRVFGIRILHRRSPFSADRNHIHHLLLDRGLSHRHITLLCCAASIVFIVVTTILQFSGTTCLIFSLAACFFAIIFMIRQMPVKTTAMRVIKSNLTLQLDIDTSLPAAGSI